jgi:hypothetical protein
MKKNLYIFIIGLVIGLSGYWIFRDGPMATKIKENALVEKVGQKLQDRAVDKIKEEMDKNKRVVINKPAGSSIPVVADFLMTDLVRAKIAAEPLLAGAEIKPEAKGGDVELRGTAGSYEQISRAMRLAFECDAARSVVSTIEVKAK